MACGGSAREEPKGRGSASGERGSGSGAGASAGAGAGANGGAASGGVANTTGGLASGAAGASGAATGGSSSAGSAAGAGSAGGAGRVPTCTGSALDADTALEKCEEGHVHRPRAVECAVTGDDAGEDAASRPRADGSVDCTNDSSKCDAFELGFCQLSLGLSARAYCFSGCRVDADCKTGQLCECRPDSASGGSCVDAACSTDADCASGYLCAPYRRGCGSGGFACLQPQDDCWLDAQCSFGPCAWDGKKRFCDASMCNLP